MADPDAGAWMLDDDATFDFSAVNGEEEIAGENVAPAEVAAAEAPKPPAEWRKTYKLAVSTYYNPRHPSRFPRIAVGY